MATEGVRNCGLPPPPSPGRARAVRLPSRPANTDVSRTLDQRSKASDPDLRSGVHDLRLRSSLRRMCPPRRGAYVLPWVDGICRPPTKSTTAANPPAADPSGGLPRTRPARHRW